MGLIGQNWKHSNVNEVTGTNPPTQTTTQQANTECNSDCRVHFPVSDTPPLYITGSGTPSIGPISVSVVDSVHFPVSDTPPLVHNR